MNKVFILIPCTNEWMDIIISDDGPTGIRVFKTKAEAEAAIEFDRDLIKSYSDNGLNTYYSIPNDGSLIALICEREIES